MVSSPLNEHDAPSDPGDSRARYGYRRHFPFWLIFPLLFLLFRAPFFWWGYGWYGLCGPYGPGFFPGFLAIIPLVVIGFFLFRFALPAVDDAVRPLFRRRGAHAEPDDERDAAHRQRLELDLIDAHRQIKELEEQVTWHRKLLDAQVAAPGEATTSAARETPEAPASGNASMSAGPNGR